MQRLGVAAAAAVGLSLPRWPRAETGVPAFNPFSLGVASGSPTATGVVLWTRLLAPAREALEPRDYLLRWELAEDEAFSRGRVAGQAIARPELAHSVHVEVDGLAPGRWYHYRFMLGDAQSRVGRTRTLPAPDAASGSLRLGYASCQRWDHGYFHAWRHLCDESLDLVLFLGDYIYEYATARDAVRRVTGGRVRSLAAYRQRYALYRSDPDLQAAHAAVPWLMVWDDHEVENDYAGAQAGDADDFHPDSFRARRAAAYQAYYEHMPLRVSVLQRALEGLADGAELRLYARIRWGRLAELMMLDDRQYRDPQVCTSGGRPGSSWFDPAECPQWADPRRTLLGAAQEAWLDNALQSASATWTVVGQQTVFGRRDARARAGSWLWNDGWDGYPAARERLLESLERHRVANPVFLGGDIHQNWVGHVAPSAASARRQALGVEFCGTSMTSRTVGNPRLEGRLEENRHFVFADSAHRGYGVAQFTPQALRTQLRVVEDVSQPFSPVRTLASFRVAAGSARLERE